MRSVFVDTQYWIAVTNRRDPWHELAVAARSRLGPALLVTTEEVLGEFLTGISRGGPRLRRRAVQIIRAMRTNPDTKIIEQSHESFARGVNRYAAREDKAYSFADCVAMNTMDAGAITDILSNDRHFEQEGYSVLLKR